MKLFAYFFLLTLAFLPLSNAQEDTVIRYENQVPDYERTAREIIASGKEEIVKTGAMILPPDGGDDTKIRFILTIIAKDASHSGNADQRPIVEEAFLQILENAEHEEIKDFLLTQFHLFGSEKSYEPLSQYLTHETLFVNAAISLIQIGDAAASPYLVDALPHVSDEAKAMLLRGSGDLQFEGDINLITPHLLSDNGGVRLAAMYALAKIGGIKPHDALLLAVQDESGVYRHQAISYLFDYANTLAASGQGFTASQIAYDVLETYNQAENSHILCAALDLLVNAKGSYAIYDLLRYAGSEWNDVSAHALALAKQIPGKQFIEMWLNKAQRSSEPLQSKIMDMLNEREDYHALVDIHFPPVSLDEPDEHGFTPLFNNVDLTGWTGDTKGYVVEDSKIVCLPGGNLYTKKEYADFVLRFEFKLPPGGNNGLGIRTPMGVNAAYGGMEIQILHDSHPMYKDIKPWQAHGSIYGVVPAKRGYLREPGQWNQEEVIAYGSQIIIRVNGTTVVNANIEKASLHGTIDGQNHPGLLNQSGHIAFLGHGFPVEFRNIRIKELSQSKEKAELDAEQPAVNGADNLEE